jgi:hypothetical protein
VSIRRSADRSPSLRLDGDGDGGAGSTLATILPSSDVSWTEVALALVVLAGLQFVLAFISSRVPLSVP